MKPNPHIDLMDCPHCHFSLTTQLKCITNLGYYTFYCRDCLSSFNEKCFRKHSFSRQHSLG